MSRSLLGVGFALLAICGAGAPSVALAMPAGHVPVYLIPYARSVSYNTGSSKAVTVVTITRVGGTAACDVSVDWRDDAGTTILATTVWPPLLPPSATSQFIGGSVHHCSHGNFTDAIVACSSYPPGVLWGYQGKVVVGAKPPCTASNLAVDARVIYYSDTSSQEVGGVHSLKVLRPHNIGNKGE